MAVPLHYTAPVTPNAIPARAVRAGWGLVVVASLLAFAIRAQAQQFAAGAFSAPLAGTTLAAAPRVPFSVGEELVFHATFGKLPAGTARMRVQGIDTVRGRAAYHVAFAIDGGFPFFRVHDTYESWIDVQTLSSLRHKQTISEGRYHRNTAYELYPERAEYQKNSEPPQPSVSNPLDDGSFIYAARIAGLRAGDTLRNARYFVLDKNPVVLTGLRDDTVTVAAGTYVTTVIRPTIKASGIFSENGQAEIWFSKDARRLPVQLKTKFSRFSLTLALQSVALGDTATMALAKR